MPRPDAESIRTVEDGERRVHRRPVQQRLTHPHEDDVGRLCHRVSQDQLTRLTGDLARPQVAAISHQPGGAEDAPQSAARLG